MIINNSYDSQVRDVCLARKFPLQLLTPSPLYFHHHLALLCPFSPALILSFIMSLPVTQPTSSLLLPNVFWCPRPLSCPGNPLSPDCLWSGLLAFLSTVTNTDPRLKGTRQSLSSCQAGAEPVGLLSRQCQQEWSVVDISKLLVYVILLSHQARKCLCPQKNAVR